MKLKLEMSVFVVIAFIFAVSLSVGMAAEKKPIKFVMLTDLTGPAHSQTGPEGWAAEDYFAWLNKNGGILGHPVDLDVIDTKYQLPLMRTAYNRIKRAKQTAVSFDALSGGIHALGAQFVKDKVPVLMLTGHGPALYPPAWVYSIMPPYDDTLCAMADWIMENWKENRKPRLALLLTDVASARSPEGAKWYCEEKGIEIVATEYVPMLPTDTSDILIRIRNAKPDFIYDTLMPDPAKVVLKNKYQLGMKTPQVNFINNGYLISKSVPLNALAGYMAMQSLGAWWEKDNPGVQFAYKLLGKRADGPPLSYMMGIGGSMVWAKAVENAIKKVGYEKLDGPSIFEGVKEIKNFKAKGIFKNVDYTTGDLRGCKWLKFTRFNNDGSVSNLTGWREAPWNLKLKAQRGKK